MSLIDYERRYNPYLRYLEKEGWTEAVESATFLLIPQSVAFESVYCEDQFPFSKEFIRGHAIVTDPKHPLHFVALSGLLGCFVPSDDSDSDEDGLPHTFFIIGKTSIDGLYDDVEAFFDSIQSLFSDAEKTLDDAKTAILNIKKDTVAEHPFLLVSEVLPANYEFDQYLLSVPPKQVSSLLLNEDVAVTVQQEEARHLFRQKMRLPKCSDIRSSMNM